MKKNTNIGLFILFFIFSFNVFSQTENDLKNIVKNYNLKTLDSLAKYFDADFKLKKNEAQAFAKLNDLPLSFVENGVYHELMYIENGKPVYYQTHNSGSANTIKVNRINTGGQSGLNLDGQNMIVGIWDGGPVRTTHQDLVGRVVVKDLENFVISNEGTSHGTHVAGTMVGSGFGNAIAKGMAPQATLWGNTFANDRAEAVSQAAQGLLVSNHSYGIPAANVMSSVRGAYVTESRDWDVIMNNAPYYQPVISAGNDRGSAQDTKGGRDLLIGNKTSKNSIVVAAVFNVSNYTSPASVNMSTFSSWGPTDDFRIKPDISAKGVSVFSLNSTSDTDYYTSQGTSMAAPAVSGALILLQQHYSQRFSSFMRASTLKAVMINGADEAGDTDGPDYKFGWGLLNAQKSANLITNRGVSSIIDELELSQGQIYTRTLVSNGSPMRVTVVWNDPAGALSSGVDDDPTPVLVNDLDVRLVKNAETFYPWVLNPFFVQGGAIQDDNPYDNVESIDVFSPSGEYTLTISHKGNLQGNSQKFSLVVSGVDEQLSLGNNMLENLVLFPNPINDFFTVKNKNYNNSTFDLEIYDVGGRLIKSYKDQSSSEEVSFNVSDLTEGIYFVKIIDGDFSVLKKIIIK